MKETNVICVSRKCPRCKDCARFQRYYVKFDHRYAAQGEGYCFLPQDSCLGAPRMKHRRANQRACRYFK